MKLIGDAKSQSQNLNMFDWSEVQALDTAGSMARFLSADKDVELGWLGYILSNDIGFFLCSMPLAFAFIQK